MSLFLLLLPPDSDNASIFLFPPFLVNPFCPYLSTSLSLYLCHFFSFIFFLSLSLSLFVCFFSILIIIMIIIIIFIIIIIMFFSLSLSACLSILFSLSLSLSLFLSLSFSLSPSLSLSRVSLSLSLHSLSMSNVCFKVPLKCLIQIHPPQLWFGTSPSPQHCLLMASWLLVIPHSCPLLMVVMVCERCFGGLARFLASPIFLIPFISTPSHHLPFPPIPLITCTPSISPHSFIAVCLSTNISTKPFCSHTLSALNKTHQYHQTKTTPQLLNLLFSMNACLHELVVSPSPDKLHFWTTTCNGRDQTFCKAMQAKNSRKPSANPTPK